MSHNININNGKASFFSAKEKAWHGLGTIVDSALTSKDAIVKAGLAYTVHKVPVYANFIKSVEQDGRYIDFNGNLHFAADKKYRGAKVPNKFATVRGDTYDIFGIVGNKYTIVQNQECFNFIDNIIQSKEAIFETAGALGKGETIFVTAKLPNYIRFDKSDDVIEDYILLTNNHDGSSNLMAMFTPIRVVCNNTLNMALRQNTNKIALRHVNNIHDKIEQSNRLMKVHNIFTVELALQLNSMKLVNITSDIANKVINHTFKIDDNILVKDMPIKTANVIDQVKQYVEVGVGQEYHRGTALWLYNGISSYFNNGVDYKTQEDKFTQLIGGNKGNYVQKAFELCSNLTN